MDFFTIIIWVVTIVFLIISFIKDKSKTIESLKMSVGFGKSLIKSILAVIFLIGLILAILPPERIASFVETQNIATATLVAAAFGTITLIPAFIAFPLVGTLVDAQFGIVPAAAFLTTLTMVGVVTFPLEKREFGVKFALVRNILSFVFAVIIAFAMGVFI